MIGFYDYTVILTYMSAISAGIGIAVSLWGQGHPYIGAMFLMLCGLFDTFDGRVARRKKGRTDDEKEFGVQIDSLSDLVAFGVLPACIGIALYKRVTPDLIDYNSKSLLINFEGIPAAIIVVISSLFILAALIRLAYFNVTVKYTQNESMGKDKFYYGLPVTSVALLMPMFLIIRHIVLVLCHSNIAWVYYVVLIIIGILFISKFKIKKPNNAQIYGLIGVGMVEFIVVILIKLLLKK